MASEDRFEELVAEAETQAFTGWDFSFMESRYEVDPAPWDYTARVTELAGTAAGIATTASTARAAT